MSNTQITLQRVVSDNTSTAGVLVYKSLPICLTMERGDLDSNVKNSRIPAGKYEVEYLMKSPSGKFTNCYYIPYVPGRSNIMFHTGDVYLDTHGGIIPVLTWKHLRHNATKVLAGLRSPAAMKLIHEITGKRLFTLTIIDPQETKS